MGHLFGDDRGAVYRTHTISAQDGIRLFVRDYGPRRGNTVICLAGMTRNSQDFHPLATRLSANYRVLVPDYRGRGRSQRDPDWRRYTPPTYLMDANHVLTALGVEHCAVVGTSLGGLLGMAFGLSMPTRLKGLLLNDIGPGVPAGAIQHVRHAVEHMAKADDWDGAVAYLKQHFPDLPAHDESDWRVIAGATFRERGDGGLEQNCDPAVARAFRAEPPDEAMLWRLFRSVGRRPLAAVRGVLTAFVDDATWSAMKCERPDMITGEVPETGHAPSLAEPEASRVIDAWLELCFGETSFQEPFRR